jgi:TPR repeat protein
MADAILRDATEALARAQDAADSGDYDTALGIWVKLGHAGVSRAQSEIGRCFVAGLGVERDVELAQKWLSLAAKGNDPLGQRLLGDFYFNGEEGRPDRAIAEEWYARAAKQGDPEAQDMLSWILTDGDHRKPDYAQAMQWAEKAAKQGNAPSMTRIGLLYHNALGVERNAKAAAHWWQKSAALGDADGQAMLGAAHHLGAGVPRDLVRALAWLTLARAARSRFADRYYNAVLSECTPEQRRAAEKLTFLPPDQWEAAP